MTSMPWNADRIMVFAGPSLAGVELAAPFVRQPPAGAGDLLRWLPHGRCTLLLIDGVFDTRAAVFHKEILWLLARGFRVIGAASMGALRAAELDGHGMIGAGCIYRAYRDGRLTSDAEVAVLHAPAELGGAALSVALVDVRATLQAAVRARVLTVNDARACLAAASAIPYRDRAWASLGAAGAFADWLPHGRVGLKAADALVGLALARDLAATPPQPLPEPPRTSFLRNLAVAVGVTL